MQYFMFIARSYRLPDDWEARDEEDILDDPLDLPWPENLAHIVQTPVVIPRLALPQLPIQHF